MDFINNVAAITVELHDFDIDAPLVRTGVVIIEEVTYDDPVEDPETFTQELTQAYVGANPDLPETTRAELTDHIAQVTQEALEKNPELSTGELAQAVEASIQEADFASNPVTKANDLANAGIQRLAEVAENNKLKAKLISGAVQAGSLALGGPIKSIGTRVIKEAAESQISGAIEDYVGTGIATLATRSDDRAEFNSQIPLDGNRHEAQATGATVIAGALLGVSPLALIKRRKKTPEAERPEVTDDQFSRNLDDLRNRNTTTETGQGPSEVEVDISYRRRADQDFDEFNRQADGQAANIDGLSAGEIRSRIQDVRQNGRPQEAIDATQEFRRNNPPPQDGLDVLHGSDCCIGGSPGPENITGYGDRGINRSLGAQNRRVRDEIEEQLKDIPDSTIVRPRRVERPETTKPKRNNNSNNNGDE